MLGVQAWELHRKRAGFHQRRVSLVRSGHSPRSVSADWTEASGSAPVDTLEQIPSVGQAQDTALSPPTLSRAQWAWPAHKPPEGDELNKRALPIETLAVFRLLHRYSTGVIVITNRSARARAHLTDCPSLTDDNFTKKVITNGGKGGGYFYFARYDDAARELNASWCKTCAQLETEPVAQVETTG